MGEGKAYPRMAACVPRRIGRPLAREMGVPQAERIRGTWSGAAEVQRSSRGSWVGLHDAQADWQTHMSIPQNPTDYVARVIFPSTERDPVTHSHSEPFAHA